MESQQKAFEELQISVQKLLENSEYIRTLQYSEVEVDVDMVGLFSYSDYKWAHLFQVWTRTDDKTGINRVTVEHLASVSQEFIM